MNPAILAKNTVQDLAQLAQVVAFSLDRHMKHRSRWMTDHTLAIDRPFKQDDLREFIQVTANLNPELFGRYPRAIEENSAVLLTLAGCLGEIDRGHNMFAEQLSLALKNRDERYSCSTESVAFYVTLRV